MTISFSILGAEAAELLSEMHRCCFQGGPEQVWTEGQFRSFMTISGTEALMILQEKQPAGFILSRNIAQEIEILTLCVLPNYRNQGIGHILLSEFCISALKSSDAMIFLEVRESNEAAIALYEKNGFKVIGRRNDYYGGQGKENQNALVMKLARN